jgi:multiple sugar transport system ATP-binding protein
MTLGDRIVIMKDGFIQQVGSPTEVFERPSNLFVAEFIGAPKMNIMRTNLLLENGKYYVTPFGSKIEVDGENGELLKKKGVKAGEILLGVRPEHINLVSSAAANTINGSLLVNEMMGSELHLHVKVDDTTKIVARIPTVDLSYEERANLKNGHEVHLTFPGKVMYFFDIETERNLIH